VVPPRFANILQCWPCHPTARRHDWDSAVVTGPVRRYLLSGLRETITTCQRNMMGAPIYSVIVSEACLRSSASGSGVIFGGLSTPPFQQSGGSLGRQRPRTCPRQCLFSALRRRGRTETKTPPHWVVESCFYRSSCGTISAGIGTRRFALVAGLLRAESLHHSG
jgi:hypothetical protein